MNLYQLEQLAAIEESKTLSAVAERLNTSQPAISKSMKKLEEELGVTLFTRTKNHIELNETGLVAAKYAGNVLDAAAAMKTGVAEFERKRRTIAVGSCAPAPLWKLLPALAGKYAEGTVSSDIRSSEEVLRGLAEDRYQIAVLPYPPEDEAYHSRPFMKEQLYLSVPPAHPLSTREGVFFKELNGETFLLMANIGFWLDLCKEKMPDSRLIINENRTDHRELVKASALPAFVSDQGLERDRDSLNRVFVKILDPEANPELYLVAKQGRILTFLLNGL